MGYLVQLSVYSKLDASEWCQPYNHHLNLPVHHRQESHLHTRLPEIRRAKTFLRDNMREVKAMVIHAQRTDLLNPRCHVSSAQPKDTEFISTIFRALDIDVGTKQRH